MRDSRPFDREKYARPTKVTKSDTNYLEVLMQQSDTHVLHSKLKEFVILKSPRLVYEILRNEQWPSDAAIHQAMRTFGPEDFGLVRGLRLFFFPPLLEFRPIET